MENNKLFNDEQKKLLVDIFKQNIYKNELSKPDNLLNFAYLNLSFVNPEDRKDLGRNISLNIYKIKETQLFWEDELEKLTNTSLEEAQEFLQEYISEKGCKGLVDSYLEIAEKTAEEYIEKLENNLKPNTKNFIRFLGNNPQYIYQDIDGNEFVLETVDVSDKESVKKTFDELEKIREQEEKYVEIVVKPGPGIYFYPNDAYIVEIREAIVLEDLEQEKPEEKTQEQSEIDQLDNGDDFEDGLEI